MPMDDQGCSIFSRFLEDKPKHNSVLRYGLERSAEQGRWLGQGPWVRSSAGGWPCKNRVVWPDRREGVTAPGKHGVSAPRKQLGAAAGWLEELPDLPMTCHNKRKQRHGSSALDQSISQHFLSVELVGPKSWTRYCEDKEHKTMTSACKTPKPPWREVLKLMKWLTPSSPAACWNPHGMARWGCQGGLTGGGKHILKVGKEPDWRCGAHFR